MNGQNITLYARCSKVSYIVP